MCILPAVLNRKSGLWGEVECQQNNVEYQPAVRQHNTQNMSGLRDDSENYKNKSNNKIDKQKISDQT